MLIIQKFGSMCVSALTTAVIFRITVYWQQRHRIQKVYRKSRKQIYMTILIDANQFMALLNVKTQESIINIRSLTFIDIFTHLRGTKYDSLLLLFTPILMNSADRLNVQVHTIFFLFLNFLCNSLSISVSSFKWKFNINLVRGNVCSVFSVYQSVFVCESFCLVVGYNERKNVWKMIFIWRTHRQSTARHKLRLANND